MHQRNTFLGILFVIIAVSGIVFETVLYRILSDENLGVILFERGLIGALLIMLISAFMGGEENIRSLFKVANKKFYVMRSVLMIVSSITMLFASTSLSTVTVTSFIVTTPLFIAPLAVLFLKEKLKLATFIGMLIGFSGLTMLINENYTAAAALGLTAAFVHTLSEAGVGIVLKQMSNHDEPLLRIIFWSFIATMFCGACIMLSDVTTSINFITKQSFSDISIVLGVSIAFIWQLFFFYKGYQRTDISRAEYGSFAMLPLSLAIGHVFFKDAIPASFFITISLLVAGLIIVMISGHEQHEGTELNN